MVDTINHGFVAINRRVWVVLIPVFLNLYLWYGWQISFQPFIENIGAFTATMTPAIEGVDPDDIAAGWRALGQYDFAQAFDRVGLVPRMTMYGFSAASGGLPLPEQILPPLDAERVLFRVSSGSIVALLFLGLNMLLIPIGAAFLSTLATAVRGDMLSVPLWLRRFGFATLALFAYIAMIVAALLLISLPFGLIGVLLGSASPALGALVGLMLVTCFFWLFIYIGFAPEAIVLANADPIQAVQASFAVVRRHFWSTLLFLLLLAVISAGLGVIWSLMVEYPVGLLVAIIVSSYIGSGLAAARMIFFRERVSMG